MSGPSNGPANGNVINLRMARKRVRRAEREAAAEINRFEHGRTKAERDLARARERRAAEAHEQGRRETSTAGSAEDER